MERQMRREMNRENRARDGERPRVMEGRPQRDSSGDTERWGRETNKNRGMGQRGTRCNGKAQGKMAGEDGGSESRRKVGDRDGKGPGGRNKTERQVEGELERDREM